MKFPKVPKSLERLVLGLAILAVLMKPSSFGAITTTEGLLKKAAYTAVILGAYYAVGEKYGIYVAGAIAVFFWFQQTKEGMEVEGKAIEGTTCPDKFNFDVAVQMCKDDKGALVKPTQVRCETGFIPNDTNDKCIQDIPPDAPSPPPPGPPPGVDEPAPPSKEEPPAASSTGSATAEKAAPAKTTEKFQGKGTIATTPGEAQDQAKNTVVLQQQSSVESFGNWGPGFPLK
jgi:hypothetical protein